MTVCVYLAYMSYCEIMIYNMVLNFVCVGKMFRVHALGVELESMNKWGGGILIFCILVYGYADSAQR